MIMLKINITLLTSGFIGPQILNFERSISLSPGPQTVLFRLITFLLEALGVDLSVSVVSLMSSYINVSKVILQLQITYGMNIGSHLIIRPLCFCFAILCFFGVGVVGWWKQCCWEYLVYI